MATRGGPVKQRFAEWLRKWADRLDWDGAPKQMSWSFTHEDHWGTVFNQQGRGCPVYYIRKNEYQRSNQEAGAHGEPCEIEWVTIGTRTPDGVHVLGSAEVVEGVTTRRVISHETAAVPERTARIGPAKLSMVRIPNWQITLRASFNSFVTVPGKNYQDALERMFGKSGIRG